MTNVSVWMQWNSWCLHPEQTTYSTRTRLLQKCCWMYEGFRCIRDVWSKLKQMRFNERDSNLSGKCSHIIEQLLSSASSDTSADVSPNTHIEKMMNRGTVFVDEEWMHFSVCQYKHLQRLKTKLTLLAVITCYLEPKTESKEGQMWAWTTKPVLSVIFF